MIKNTKNLALLTLAIAGTSVLSAQVSVNASGGNASGAGGTASFSVGQVFYLSGSGSGGNYQSGVQHAYEIFTTGLALPDKPTVVSVFPNPTADVLQVQFAEPGTATGTYRLMDALGKVLLSNNITGQSAQISMADLPPGNYFLQVIRNNREIQSFTVLKN